MKLYRKIMVLAIIGLFLGAGIVPSISENFERSDDCPLPIWEAGDSWTYDMTINGGIENRMDLDNLKIMDLKFIVVEVQNDRYKLDMTADLSGSVEVEFDILSLSGTLKEAELEGTMYVNKSSLAIKKVENLHAEGYIKPPILPRVRFEVEGDVNFSYDVSPLDFPINVDENWIINGTIIGLDISVDILGQSIPVNLDIYIEDHGAQVIKWDVVESWGIQYDALKISTDLGDQHNIWYSPGIGNIVKVVGRNVPFSWGGHGFYDIDMELKSTTYPDPPNIPDTPSGPTTLGVGVAGGYTTSAIDPDDTDIRYIFNWGDGTTTTDFTSSGTPLTISHTWTNKGEYSVKAKAQNTYGAESEWSDSITVTILNTAPEKPSTPDGPANGRIDQPYPYSTYAIDVDGHKIKYGWDWNGDDIVDEWTSLFNSGEVVTLSHTWTEIGEYEIKVKAKDQYNEESDWSDPISVSMPRNKPYFKTPFLNFLENHPHLFPILRYILAL